MATDNLYTRVLAELNAYLSPLDGTGARIQSSEHKIEQLLGKHRLDFKGYNEILQNDEKYFNLKSKNSDLRSQVELIGHEYTAKEMAALTSRGPIMMGQEDGRLVGGRGPTFTWGKDQESKLQADVEKFHKNLLQRKKEYNNLQVDLKHWDDSMATDAYSKEFAKRYALNMQETQEANLPEWAKGLLNFERPFLGSVYEIPFVGNILNNMIHTAGEAFGVDTSDLFHTPDPKPPLVGLWDSILDLVVTFLNGLGFDVTRDDVSSMFTVILVTSVVIFVVLPAIREIKGVLR